MPLWTDSNALELLENGDAFFTTVLNSIQHAQHDIFFETYIYQWDTIGQKLGDAFLQAVKRGVRVHVLLDGFGSLNFPSEVMNTWRQNGIQACFYRPLKGFWILKKETLPRLHRKCIVIDRHIAFVGGINVADDHLQQLNQAPRLDYAVRIEGPLVSHIHKRIASFFFRQSKDWKHYFSTLKFSLSPSSTGEGHSRAAFITRSTITHRRKIEKEYLKAMTQAQKNILIANAYFLPGLRFRLQLKRARKRGVRVQLLLQGHPEFRFVKWATQAMYCSLLKHGIEIYEYNSAYLHCKVATIDHQWSTVGSCNLDPLSLIFNLEANLIILDKTFAENLHEKLNSHIQRESTKKIELEDYQNRSLLARFLHTSCLFLIRWLTSLPS